MSDVEQIIARIPDPRAIEELIAEARTLYCELAEANHWRIEFRDLAGRHFERIGELERELAEARACIEDVLNADGDLYSMDFDRYRAFLTAADQPTEVGVTYSGNRSGSLPRQGFDSPAPCPSTPDKSTGDT